MKAKLIGVGVGVATAICAVVTAGAAAAICGFVLGATAAVVSWFDYAASTNQCATIKYGVNTAFTPIPGVSNNGSCHDGVPQAVSLMTRFNNKCLDADLNTINRNGITVQLWDCNAQNQQKWMGRSGAISSRYNGRCLDADLNSVWRNGT